MIKFKQFLKESEENIPNTSNWKKIHERMGSTEGGVYQDEKGKNWYVKHHVSEHHARNELVANKLYNEMGFHTLNQHLIRHGTRFGLASPMENIKGINLNNPNHMKEVNRHLGAHSLLANWDSMPVRNHGIINGKIHVLDTGGALEFRAHGRQGKMKGEAFGNTANEINTLRDSNINPEASQSYGHMNKNEIKNSIHPVLNLSHERIHDVIHKYGYGSTEDKNKLVNKLINRKKSLEDYVK